MCGVFFPSVVSPRLVGQAAGPTLDSEDHSWLLPSQEQEGPSLIPLEAHVAQNPGSSKGGTGHGTEKPYSVTHKQGSFRTDFIRIID